MKLHRILPLLILPVLTLSSCLKERFPDTGNTDLRTLQVPQSFNWSNAADYQLTVNLTGAQGQATEGRIMQLFDDQNIEIAIAIVQDGKAIFNAEIPARVQQLSLFFPMTRTRLELAYQSGRRSVEMNIGDGAPLKSTGKLKSGSPDCSDGCTRTVSGNVSSLTLAEGEVVCLTGTLNGGLTIRNNATLRICGTANISWVDIRNNKSVTIIVTETGTLTSSNFYMGGANHKFYNWGSANIGNWVDVKGGFENYNKVTIKGMEVYAGKTMYNEGDITSDGEVNVGGTFINDGSFEITGSYGLNLYDFGTIENNCQLKVARNFNLSSSSNLSNNGYLRVEQWIYSDTRKNIELGNGSMISSANIYVNSPLLCSVGQASVKVDNTTQLDGLTSFTGSIDWCDETGIDSNWGATLGENVTYCEIYIPVSGCNPEGIGTPAVKDADGDGIVDDEDEFPNDPTRAFTLSEPYSGYKVWAFEDLWPSTGDYDFNDLVIATKISYSLDAQQRPVDAEVEVVVRGLGAGLHNGLGLQFLAGKYPGESFIKEIEGENARVDGDIVNGVILAEDVMEGLSPFYNNNGVGPDGDPQTWKYQLTFATELLPEGAVKGDFFLFRSSNRKHEVHVAGVAATSAADQNLFGSGDDYTMPGEDYWYKTMNGIPWGITLLTEEIDWAHPIEKTSILKAYPEFEGWAVSGGSENQSWFKNGVYENCYHGK